jgi:hypothetical protein
MDTDLNSSISKPATPFPSAASTPAAAPSRTPAAAPAVADAASAATDLLGRATQRAHDFVDGVSAKVSGVTGSARDKLDDVTQARDEWMTAARDTVREHPLLAIGGALLVGAALHALTSSGRDR